MVNDVEEWRAVPGFPGIKASSHGRIQFAERQVKGRTYKTKPTFGNKVRVANYWRLMVSNSFWKNLRVSRLVCTAFHGWPPVGRPYCLHRDENSLNNRADNLYWGTQKENLNAPGFIAYCKGRTGASSPFAKGKLRKTASTQEALSWGE